MSASHASDADAAWMQRALALAERARPISAPNPAVGCVLINPQGQLIGQGHTQPVGQAHAEIMALRDAAAHGHDTRGATAYVTLEPCAHHGRTGPCCDALAAAGIARVVAALQDPNPRVAGGGFARLRAAGVQVSVGLGQARARELNLGFLTRMTRGTPWLRLKAASSLDGHTALPNGHSQWITAEAARADGQRWRAQACAVLTGIGTVLQDDPLLNVRHGPAPGQPPPRQPALIVLDSQLRTPLGARLWQASGRRVLIATTVAQPQRHAPYQAQGAQVLTCPADAQGRIQLPPLLQALAAQEINEIHAEAGHTLNSALLAQDLADELLLYLAPRLLGAGPGMASLPGLSNVNHAPLWHWHSLERLGPDLRLLLRRQA